MVEQNRERWLVAEGASAMLAIFDKELSVARVRAEAFKLEHDGRDVPGRVQALVRLTQGGEDEGAS